MCEFLESVESSGYSRYRSIANATHFLAFNAKGKPLRYNPRLSMGYEENCINFVKIDTSFNITRHNKKMSGGSSTSPEFMRIFQQSLQHSTSSKQAPIKHKRRHHKEKRRKAWPLMKKKEKRLRLKNLT